MPTDAEWADAAKRCSDEINLHCAMGNIGKWIAVRLIDGGSDHVAYDSRRDAIRHQLHERMCMYIVVPPDGMPPEHAIRLLALHRKVYDAGFRFSDPDGPEVITPSTMEDLHKALGNIKRVRIGYRK